MLRRLGLIVWLFALLLTLLPGLTAPAVNAQSSPQALTY